MAVEGIIANGVTEILKKLNSVVVNEITLVWYLKDEFKNLHSTLNMIMAVMEDAEKKQLSSNTVRHWMENLRSIAYDAEDILDEYSYEVILRKREKEEEYKSTVFNKVRNLFSSSKPSFVASWKLARKVKKINENFNKIAKRMNDLGLQIIDVGSSSSQHELMMKNRETNSFVLEDWKFVGRENEKSTIIKMVLEEEEENSTNQGGGRHVSVIPIVGMGGLGKTTLAQQVYNDEAIQKHFELKIWIYVSDPFDIKKLYKNIANSIGKGKEYDEATTMNDISRLLRDAFRGRKFILVLDDVWNGKPENWNYFKTPFMVGREGSKILVTTRNENVALIMADKFQPYPLGILNESDSWYLFQQIAFGSAARAVETPNLVKIGKEMVKRCGGLPLAVTVLGKLMRSKKHEEEWMIIRDRELWHEYFVGENFGILPSLRLSYDYLPSHLKLCFSYCCLFPRDCIIERERLIRLWKAEGFLFEMPGENKMSSMEEIGNKYFHSLLSSFFFYDVVNDEDGDIATCKIHDLVHDLACSVVGKHECLIIENAHDIDYISEATRRLSLLVNLDDEEMLAKVLEALKKAKNLRTVLVVNKQNIRFDIGIAFKENKRLRVLDLSGSDVTTESPSSIGGFKNLRYLGVNGALFQKGIGRLSFLQTLSEFNVGDKKKKELNASVIEELGGLNLLSRDLRINNLQNVTSETDACRANLDKKKSLHGLQLSWRWRWNTKLNNNHEAVLKGLRPHPNLRTLCIEGFEGSNLPRWIEDPSRLPNLVKLTLDGGIYKQLAGFGALRSLRVLHLSSVDVECIGEEFYDSAAIVGRSLSSSVGGGEIGRSSSSSVGGGGGEIGRSSSSVGGEIRSSTASGEASTASTAATTTTSTTTTAFPSLKSLILDNMLSLKEWNVPLPSTTGATCFPSLEEISIWSCPLLTTITPTTTIFPSLKVLDLRDIDIYGRAAETLVTNNLNSLTSLRLDRISKLISLPHQGLIENNNTLLSLEIKCCYDFKGFFSSSSSSLQSLKFYDCPALRVFPDIRSLTFLRKLVIRGCNISKSLQDELTCLSSSLEHLEYVHILEDKYSNS